MKKGNMIARSEYEEWFRGISGSDDEYTNILKEFN